MEITLTELAATKVKEIREADKVEADMALRLKVQGGGCSGFTYDLYFDKPQDGDIKYNFYDVAVVVDNMSAMYLDGTTVDYVEGLQGAGFKFNNPSTRSTCACGSSFSV
jgi:iron-sulfur cluster insertion protein